MAQCEITGLGLHVKVANIAKSREFYESLGFKPVFAYGDEEFRSTLPKGMPSAPEKYRGMAFKLFGDPDSKYPVAELEIAEGHLAVKHKEVFREKIKSEKLTAMVRVKSIVPLFGNPLVKIKFPIRKYYWNTIEAAFRDPDGFVLIFIAPYSEEEFNRVLQFTDIEVVEPGKKIEVIKKKA